MLEFLNRIDTSLFLFLNGINSEGFDQLMWLISYKYTWTPLYLIILAWIIFRFRKKSLVIIPVIILLAVASDQISVHLFKNVFERLRPCHAPELAGMVHLVKNHCGGSFGFVSSHAANTSALAVFTAFLFRSKAWSWFILSWAFLNGYSRIYLGVHYPGDVLVGFMLGAVLGLTFIRLLDRFYPHLHKKPLLI